MQTALDLSPRMSSQQIDTQARLLKAKVNIADFADSKKLEHFLASFATMYDVKHVSDPNAAAAASNPLLYSAAAQDRGENPGVDFSLILRRQNASRLT